MQKPRIIVPLAWYPEIGARRVINQAYFDAISAAGGIPFGVGHMSDPEDLDTIINNADALYLIGGTDVVPERYGEELLPHNGYVNPERDHTEIELLKRAEAGGIPVLGICRGMQIMNIFADGTLHQDIGVERPGSLKHDWHNRPEREYLAHDVTVAENSLLSSLIGARTVKVNSLHHQGIDRLGAGLRVAATAPDGLVEAIERPDRPFWLGVQWHPEELTGVDPRWKNLFTAFVEAARNKPTPVTASLPR